jgi:hypothetical protein
MLVIFLALPGLGLGKAGGIVEWRDLAWHGRLEQGESLGGGREFPY